MDKTIQNKFTRANNLIYGLYKQWKNGEIDDGDLSYMIYVLNQTLYIMNRNIEEKREKENV